MEEYCFLCEYHADDCQLFGEQYVCGDCVVDAVNTAIENKAS